MNVNYIFLPFLGIVLLLMAFCLSVAIKQKNAIKDSINGKIIAPECTPQIKNDYSDCDIVMPSYSCPECGSVIEQGAYSCSFCGYKRPYSVIRYQKTFQNRFNIGLTSQYYKANADISKEVNAWFLSHSNLENVNINMEYNTNLTNRLLKKVTVSFTIGEKENNTLYGVTPIYNGFGLFWQKSAQDVFNSWKSHNPNCLVLNITGGTTNQTLVSVSSGGLPLVFANNSGAHFIAFKTNRN